MRGKATLDNAFPAWFKDHPRMCGEKLVAAVKFRSRSGSPPHVRGKGAAPALALCQVGITPACAGKSMMQSRMATVIRDHPRMCGEKALRLTVQDCLPGSPPHVRGKATATPSGASASRITPACAGKSRDAYRAQDCGWDHPRMCGEKLQLFAVNHTQVGSPPHVRGKAGCAG